MTDTEELELKLTQSRLEVSRLRALLIGATLSVQWRADIMHGVHGINPDPDAHMALLSFAEKCRQAVRETGKMY